MNDRTSVELLALLREMRTVLLRPGNDFSWSTWPDAEAAVAELDSLIGVLESGRVPVARIGLLFAPTGPIQEVSISSGWGREFLPIAARCDALLGECVRPAGLPYLRAPLLGAVLSIVGFFLSVGLDRYADRSKNSCLEAAARACRERAPSCVAFAPDHCEPTWLRGAGTGIFWLCAGGLIVSLGTTLVRLNIVGTYIRSKPE